MRTHRVFIFLVAMLVAMPAWAQFSIQVQPGGRSGYQSGGGFQPGKGRGNWMLIEPRRSSPENDAERRCEDKSGQEAIEACTAAYYLDKENKKNLRRLGDAYLATGRPKDALGAYNEALRLDPEYDDALKGRQAALSYLAASGAPAPAPGPIAAAPAGPNPYATPTATPGYAAPGYAAPGYAAPGYAPVAAAPPAPVAGVAPVAAVAPAPTGSGTFDGEWTGTLTPRGGHYVVSVMVTDGKLTIDQDRHNARIIAKADVAATGQAELRGSVRDHSLTRAWDLEVKGVFNGNMFKGSGRVGDRWADMLLTRSSPPRSAATTVAQAPAAPAPAPQKAAAAPAQPQPAPAPEPAPVVSAPPAPEKTAVEKKPADKPVQTAAAPPKPAPSTTVAPAPVALTDKKAPVITAPPKLETKGPVVELSGRIADDSTIIEFSINGQPVPVDANGRFSVRRGVPVGASELKLAAVDEWGNLSEKTVAISRNAPAPSKAASSQTAALPDAKSDPAAAEAKPQAATLAEQLKGIKFGSYRAVVIGNNKYQHLQKLDTATRDAQVVADILTKSYGFKVDLLIDATRQQIMESLYRMRAELQTNDNLLVYYAGHGVVDKDTGRGYWLPVDAVSDIPTQWVPTTDLTDVIKAMRAKHIMVVADSCYSGALVRSATAGIKSAKDQDVGAWVTKILAKRSRTVLSSGGLEPVMDGGGEGHSVFAKAFIDALRDNRAVMDGQALFSTIRRPIVLNSDQTPEYSDIRQAGHDGGDFLFVRR